MDETIWDQMPEVKQAKLMEECFAYDDELRRSGLFMFWKQWERRRASKIMSRQIKSLNPKNFYKTFSKTT
jgi:hypothetical protein